MHSKLPFSIDLNEQFIWMNLQIYDIRTLHCRFATYNIYHLIL